MKTVYVINDQGYIVFSSLKKTVQYIMNNYQQSYIDSEPVQKIGPAGLVNLLKEDGFFTLTLGDSIVVHVDRVAVN